VWLHDGEKIEDMISRFDTIPECDRLTDERTDILRQHSPRYAQHRVVKIWCETQQAYPPPELEHCGRTNGRTYHRPTRDARDAPQNSTRSAVVIRDG